MYYKLSNVASVDEMECVFDAKFKYRDLHHKDPIINGLEESLLPVITNMQPKDIQFGIWGRLPEDYKEDWSVFQDTMNTLNMDVKPCVKDTNKNLFQKRCIVIVSGYYLSYVHEGEVFPFYTYPKSKKPMAIAGLYTTTYDGYITFSLLLTSAHPKVSKYHNISAKMPLTLALENQKKWLSEDYEAIFSMTLTDYETLDFQSHPISRVFYKNNIYYDSFLDPTEYESLIIPT